jgi:hypothetical protein
MEFAAISDSFGARMQYRQAGSAGKPSVQSAMAQRFAALQTSGLAAMKTS